MGPGLYAYCLEGMSGGAPVPSTKARGSMCLYGQKYGVHTRRYEGAQAQFD